MQAEIKQYGLMCLVRDWLVWLLPVRRIPKGLIRVLYGFSPDYIFLTHPRSIDDFYMVAPFVRRLSFVVPDKILRAILKIFPVYVVSRVCWEGKINGLIITTPFLPQELLENRDKTVKIAGRIIRFIHKISAKRIYVGLAAWWPIATNNGLAFNRFSSNNLDIEVTSGHTVTLVSLYLTVVKIAEAINIPLEKLRILILGVGRVGEGAANIFNGRVCEIGLADKNVARLRNIKRNLITQGKGVTIETHDIRETTQEEVLEKVLSAYHVAVCTTSNVGFLIKDETKLKNCIIVDDSRPEAFPRVFSRESCCAVIEGGLMKIPGIKMDKDFGFGNTENVFGCLAEAFILALDANKKLHPMIGEINVDDFEKVLSFCKETGIEAGDFLSGHRKLSGSELRGMQGGQ